jgi:osmoprotectant transport system permease protein
VPFFGLGFESALPALILLAIPPILVNAVAGLRSVDAEMVEAGRGMGLTEWGVLRDVELPAALPAIAAGLRTAAVQVVATATLAALVAGGGLGRYIVDGFALQRYDRLVAGAILVALLALLTERLFGLAQARFERRAGRRPDSPSGPDASPGSLVVA